MKLHHTQAGFLIIGLLVVLGMSLRLMAIQHTVILEPIRADAYDYFFYAANIAEHGVYSRMPDAVEAPTPDALRSPGFPWFASAFYQGKVQESMDHLLIAQTLLQIASFLFLSLILIRKLGAWYSLLPIMLLWTFPHFISVNTYYLSESLFTSLLALAIAYAAWLDVRNFAKRDLAHFIMLGLLLGLAILTRPTLQYFPWFLLLVLALVHRKLKPEYLAVTVAALVPGALWGIRNLLAIGQWSDPTLSTLSLYHGSFPLFMYNNDPTSFAFPYRFDPMAERVNEGMGATLALIRERVMQDPAAYIRWYLAGKQFFLWQWSIIAGHGDIFIYTPLQSPYLDNTVARFTHSFNKFIHPVWICLAFTGLAMLIHKVCKKRETITLFWFFPGALFLYAILIHVLVASFPRYGIPFKVAAMLMAVFAIKEIYQWIAQKRSA